MKKQYCSILLLSIYIFFGGGGEEGAYSGLGTSSGLLYNYQTNMITCPSPLQSQMTVTAYSEGYHAQIWFDHQEPVLQLHFVLGIHWRTCHEQSWDPEVQSSSADRRTLWWHVASQCLVAWKRREKHVSCTLNQTFWLATLQLTTDLFSKYIAKNN